MRDILKSGSNVAIKPPVTIKKVCIWVGVDYRLVDLIPIETNSLVFQWPEAPGGHSWLEGPTLKPTPASPGAFTQEQQNFYKIACPMKRETPYALVEGEKAYLVTGKRRDINRDWSISKIYDQIGHNDLH